MRFNRNKIKIKNNKNILEKKQEYQKKKIKKLIKLEK
jgi:hypothetical protein